MGEIDVCSGRYLSVEERCADALNAGCFNGERVILPEQIHEIDSVTNLVVRDKQKPKGKRAIQPRRDVLKVVTHNANFCIVGIENQADVHYVMPVRIMLYDASQYEKQWGKIRKEHKLKDDLEDEEKLSGFSKEDKLKAVVTLVVYYGTKPWEGAKDLHSLIDWEDIPRRFRELVPNYSIYLLELNNYKNLDDFQSDLKAVCRFIQNSEDEQKLRMMLKEHGDEFTDLSEDTYDLLEALGNMTQLKAIKNVCKKEDGGFDMCKGLEDWLESSRNEGAHAKLYEIVANNINKGKTVEVIADFLGESVDTILAIVDEIKGQKAI